MPGSTFQLPSAGILYDNGELTPDVTNGELKVLPMTAYDEIIMKTPDKLLNGTAIEDVFKRCIPQIKKPYELFVEDIDFLMVSLRLMSLGDSIEMKYAHNCKPEGTDNPEHTYVGSIEHVLREVKLLDTNDFKKSSTETVDGKFVHLTPMRYKDVLDIMQKAANKNLEITPEIIHEETIKQLGSVIAKVVIDDTTVTNKEQIHEWLVTLKIGDIRKITSTLEGMVSWGVDPKIEVECKECSEQLTLPIQLNPISFF